jgi:hypothetical protein
MSRKLAETVRWIEDGRRVIDYRRFHDTEPLAAAR